MEEPGQKRMRVDRAEWAKRVERWRDSGLTTAEFAAELGVNPRTLTYWAWALKREARGASKQRPVKTMAPADAGAPVPGFVEIARSPLLAGMRKRGNSVKFTGEPRAFTAVKFTGDGGHQDAGFLPRCLERAAVSSLASLSR